jgi:HPt (histidine-containing phosphotransfer) domain-containing protein
MAYFKDLTLLFADDAEALREVLKAFSEDIPKSLIALKSECQKQNWQGATKIIHQIKPFYGYAGHSGLIELVHQWQAEPENASVAYKYEATLTALEAGTTILLAQINEMLNQ